MNFDQGELTVPSHRDDHSLKQKQLGILGEGDIVQLFAQQNTREEIDQANYDYRNGQLVT